MKKSKYSELIDLGGDLLIQLFNLGIHLGEANAKLIEIKRKQTFNPPDELKEFDSFMNIIVEELDTKYPNFLDLTPAEQDKILNNELLNDFKPL